MSDPNAIVTLHIGQQTRRLFFGVAAFRAARKAFPDRRLVDVLQNMDVGDVPDLLVLGLMHEDRAVDVVRVSKWIEAEPKRMVEFQLAAVTAAAYGYKRFEPTEAATGEALAAAAKLETELTAGR